ncbi:metallophosphoesterase family protein [Methanobrevibacter filiformis]|uniref:3',5'-cyclic adenosine monophosphate phosphodiesterase CpdA n=1 Tax=Methanobrevibacter filiformis TaxID=55758 RepID=A0A166A9M7_9EURY|nr:metallophosphoesterase [Methanobrevibacter filiformis]KZX11754.1 3',5'-cyclic adenosine monophosphate phosphodiesterase CpdA [Methanobrevibacter filiformis]
MKILQVSDVHSEDNSKFNRYLDENDIDLLIISGDITNFGPPEFAINFLNNIFLKEIPIIAIPGNCDNPESIEAIKRSNAIFAHNKVIFFKGIIIYSFGGSNPTPFNTPFEFSEEELYDNLKNLFNKSPLILDENDKRSFIEDNLRVLLTHAPPIDSEADKIENGAHVGSSSVNKIIKEFNPNLNLCGHIHEAESISKINDTIVVNPGMLKNNKGILIDINGLDIKVNIIEFN